MARRKTKAAVKTEEAVEAEAVEVTEELEVTDEFHLQEVSDTTDSYEDIVEAGLVDLDKTEVEAEIEEGAELEIVEEVVESSEPAKKAKKAKPEARKNRTTVDTRVSAAEILKNQAEKEANDEKRKEKQRMTRVKPVISQEKKNNGIRTSAGLFFR